MRSGIRILDAIGAIGPDASEVVSMLLYPIEHQLEGRNAFWLTSAVIRALGRIGPGAGQAVDPLGRLLVAAIKGDRRHLYTHELTGSMVSIDPDGSYPWFVEALKASDDAIALESVILDLPRCGTRAVEMIPWLEKTLQESDDENMECYCRTALSDLKGEQPQVQSRLFPYHHAMRMFGEQFSPRGRYSNTGYHQDGLFCQVVLDLIALSGQADDVDMYRIMEVLKLFGADSVGALSLLIPHLQQAVPDTWKWHHAMMACTCIGKIGPSAEPAVNALLKLLKTEDLSSSQSIQRAAVKALSRIEAAGSSQPILKLLQASKDPDTKKICIVAMTYFPGHEREACIPVLTEILQEPRMGDLHREVCIVLGELAPASEPAVSALIEAIDSDVKYVSDAALEALGMIGPASQLAVETLISRKAVNGLRVLISKHDLKDSDPRFKDIFLEAVKDLEHINVDLIYDVKYYLDERAIPALIRLVEAENDWNWPIQEEALGALSMLGVYPEEVLSCMGNALYHSDVGVSLCAVRCLIDLDDVAKSWHKTIIEVYKSGRWNAQLTYSPDLAEKLEALQRS